MFILSFWHFWWVGWFSENLCDVLPASIFHSPKLNQKLWYIMVQNILWNSSNPVHNKTGISVVKGCKIPIQLLKQYIKKNKNKWRKCGSHNKSICAGEDIPQVTKVKDRNIHYFITPHQNFLVYILMAPSFFLIPLLYLSFYVFSLIDDLLRMF